MNDGEFSVYSDEELQTIYNCLTKTQSGYMSVKKYKYSKRTGSSGNYTYFYDDGKGGVTSSKDKQSNSNLHISDIQLNEFIYNSKKDGKTFSDFADSLGSTHYRGGHDLSIDKVTDSGISVSNTRQVATDFAEHTGGSVKEFVILSTAKQIDFRDIPIPLNFKDITPYSDTMIHSDDSIWDKLEIEYQKAVDWAKENSYDIVKLPLEGELRILKLDIIKDKTELKNKWDNIDKNKKINKNMSVKKKTLKELPKKTALDYVMIEMEKEYNEMVEKAVNKIIN